eukprot:169983-Rhodomonas_salina.2
MRSGKCYRGVMENTLPKAEPSSSRPCVGTGHGRAKTATKNRYQGTSAVETRSGGVDALNSARERESSCSICMRHVRSEHRRAHAKAGDRETEPAKSPSISSVRAA